MSSDLSNFNMLQDPSRRRSRRGQSHKKDDENERLEDQKLFVCRQPGCPRMFSSKFKLDRHVLIHTGIRKYMCGKCGKRFHRKDHLKNHFEVHNVNKPKHLCELCPKAYASLLSFRKHIAYHAAQAGDLVCRLCGKPNADRESILQHLKVHSTSRTLRGPGERKFPCDRCERSFFTKKDVKRHLVVHTGKRDFMCEYCPQRFGRKDHLVRHKKKSHSVCTSSLPTDSLHKYDASPPILNENMKPDALVSNISRLEISPPSVQPILDPPVVEVCKQEYVSPPPPPPPPPPPSNIVQPSFSVGHISGEGGPNMTRFVEPPLLPVSQYVPISPTYSTVSPIMSHHYLNVSTSGNMLPDLLPPMTVAPPFPGAVPLDMGNPPLPHFSQAFHQQ